MKKYTPGPWEIWGEHSLHITGKATMKGRRVCSMLPNPQAEDLANARLISAAPEMLEALEELTEIIRRFGGIPVDDPFKFDKLIKKARGDS